jgi:hypothetical protein
MLKGVLLTLAGPSPDQLDDFKKQLQGELELAKRRVKHLERVLKTEEAFARYVRDYLREERARLAVPECTLSDLEARKEALETAYAEIEVKLRGMAEAMRRPRRRGRPVNKDTKPKRVLMAKALDVELAKGGLRKLAIAEIMERFGAGEKTVRNAHDEFGEVRPTRKRKQNGK